MSCVQQTGTQSETAFVTCCHLSGNCSTTNHIVATDEYLKEGEIVRITGVDLYVEESTVILFVYKQQFGYEILSNVLMEEQLKTDEYVQEHRAVKLPCPRGGSHKVKE
jgi:hypothetical protein